MGSGVETLPRVQWTRKQPVTVSPALRLAPKRDSPKHLQSILFPLSSVLLSLSFAEKRCALRFISLWCLLQTDGKFISDKAGYDIEIVNPELLIIRVFYLLILVWIQLYMYYQDELLWIWVKYLLKKWNVHLKHS